MIVVNINGGLGNQLFQYAFGRNLSILFNTELLLYIEDYKYNWLRNFELNHFNIKGRVIGNKELDKLNNDKKIVKITESRGGHESNILKLQDNAFYSGNWQTSRYFETNFDMFHNDFNINTFPSVEDSVVLQKILSSNSICIHIRRGDYITRKSTFIKYGSVCNIDYYMTGVRYIIDKVKDPSFFVFSDDIQWAKQNLKIETPVYFIDHNYSRKHYNLEKYYLFRNSLILFKKFYKDLAFQDLRLMSNCKHFIISNSTFSWWGAWLASNKEKIVIAPGVWSNDFQNDQIIPQSSDHIIPENWIKI
jgi:hypothetical protein